MLAVGAKIFSHYIFSKIQIRIQCLQGFQKAKLAEGVKVRISETCRVFFFQQFKTVFLPTHIQFHP